MGSEATARWRRRGWRAFGAVLPTVLPRRTLVVLAVVTLALVLAGAVLAAVHLADGAPLRAGVAGGLVGVGVAAFTAAVTCLVRVRGAQRGLRRVRVLDEGLLVDCLAEDDTVTADAATVEKLRRLVDLTRASTPPLILSQLLLAGGAVLVVIAAVLVGAAWTSVVALPISALGAAAGTLGMTDALGRTETVATALARGTVVEPVVTSRRPTATWHDADDGEADPRGRG